MTTLEVQLRLVDGGFLSVDVDAAILDRHDDYVRRGYSGKLLIHKIWSDDLRPPPITMKIIGTAPDGRTVDITIPYQ